MMQKACQVLPCYKLAFFTMFSHIRVFLYFIYETQNPTLTLLNPYIPGFMGLLQKRNVNFSFAMPLKTFLLGNKKSC